MSEEEEQQGARKVIVTVDNAAAKLAAIERKEEFEKAVQQQTEINELRQMKEKLSYDLNEKHGCTDFSSEMTVDDLMKLDRELLEQEESKPEKRVSAGVVRLSKSGSLSRENSIWKEEFESPDDFIHSIYSAYRSETDPQEKQKLKEALETFWEKKIPFTGMKNASIDLSVGLSEGQCARDLKKVNFTFNEYKSWLKKKMAKASA